MLIAWLHHILDFIILLYSVKHEIISILSTEQTQRVIHPESPPGNRYTHPSKDAGPLSVHEPPPTFHSACMMGARIGSLWWFWGWEFEVGLCGKLFIHCPSGKLLTELREDVQLWYDGWLGRHHTCSIRARTHTRTDTPVLCLSSLLSTLCSFQSNQALEETEESTDTMGAALIKSIISHLALRVCWKQAFSNFLVCDNYTCKSSKDKSRSIKCYRMLDQKSGQPSSVVVSQ